MQTGSRVSPKVLNLPISTCGTWPNPAWLLMTLNDTREPAEWMQKPLYTCLKTKFNRCSSIVCQNVGPMFWLRVVVITAGAHQAAHETPRPSRCRFSYKFANYVGTAARTDSRELTRRRSCSGVSTAALRARGRGRMTRRKKTFAREPSFQSRRKHHSSTSSSSTDGDREEGTERTTSNPTTIRWAAENRFQLYAIFSPGNSATSASSQLRAS